MQEFICPNGRMSINGACPIFEGGDGQIRDYQTPKTFDEKYNEIEDIEKQREKSGFFKFDFEKETPSAKKTAGNIINENIGAYNSFVENNLGIPSSVQNVARIGSAISGFGTYGVVGAIAPFAIPFIAGAALNNKAQKQQQVQQEAIARDVARDMQESNRANKTGGYQAGYSRDFMEGPSGGGSTGGSPGSSGPGGSDSMGSF